MVCIFSHFRKHLFFYPILPNTSTTGKEGGWEEWQKLLVKIMFSNDLYIITFHITETCTILLYATYPLLKNFSKKF